MAKDQPLFNAYVVTEKHRKSYWHKVGVVFEHQDGEGFNLIIPEGISVSGQVTLRKPKPRTEVAPDEGHFDGEDDIPM